MTEVKLILLVICSMILGYYLAAAVFKKFLAMTRLLKLIYVKDMLTRFPKYNEDEQKFNRWLGFVQGVLWTLDLRSIDQMREDNRNDLNGIRALREIDNIVKDNTPTSTKLQ